MYTGVTDQNRNAAAPITESFVLVDRENPVLTPNNRSFIIQAARGSMRPFSNFDRGATAIDFVYGNLTSVVTVLSGGGFSEAAAGVYEIQYSAGDPGKSYRTFPEWQKKMTF